LLSAPHASKAAFIEGAFTLTYGELAEQSGKLAALYAAHGLQPEDRAAMIALHRQQSGALPQ